MKKYIKYVVILILFIVLIIGLNWKENDNNIIRIKFLIKFFSNYFHHPPPYI